MKIDRTRFAAGVSALSISLFAAMAGARPPKSDASAAKPTGMAASAPVTVESLGLSAEKDRLRYRVRVGTAKPISQVDLAVKFADGGGKSQTETVIWQNIVHSKRQPIENGKSYEDDSYLGPDTKSVEVRLKRVVYVDGTIWSPSR